VDDRGEIGPGQVEWLDLGPTAPAERPTASRRSRRPWYLLAAAIAVAVILVAALNHDTKRSTASPSRPPTIAATEPAFPSSADAPSPTAPPSVAVTNLGHRLLDVPSDWEVFARGTNSVVRIELAKGRITTTPAPELSGGTGVSFIVGPDRVIAVPMDDQNGYQLRDGHRVSELPTAFGPHGPALPGPDPNHVWVPTDAGGRSAMTLIGLDGHPTGQTIRVPEGIGTAESDGAGYVQFNATGGVYDARPGRVTRITSGALLAIGPTRWLTEECSVEFRCVTAVTNRATGARHTLAVSQGNYSFTGYNNGLIAPDGSVAALVRDDGQEGRLLLSLFDLSNGAFRETDVILNPDQAFSGGGVLAWSPDSRWLFIVADAGRLLALDRESMRVTELSRSLPFLTQVGFRSG
jgi:hypothetical protein